MSEYNRRLHSRMGFLSQGASATAAAGLLAVSPAGAQSNSAATVLRIACFASDGATSVIYAKKAGLFSDAGLDVQIETQSNGAAIAAALASGVYDIANIGITTVLLAHEKGIPFIVVAPAAIYDSSEPLFTGAIALKESSIRTGKDLKNATIGISTLGGLSHDAICAWVDKNGGDSSTLRFVEIPFSIAGTAVEQHRVVAAEISEPVMTTDLDTGKFNLLPVGSAIAPRYILSAWFATREFSVKQADAIRRFSRVVAAAGAYANAHRAETAPIMAEFTRIPVDEYLRMPRALQGGTLSPGLIQPTITAAAKYGSLKKVFRAEDLIDSTLL